FRVKVMLVGVRSILRCSHFPYATHFRSRRGAFVDGRRRSSVCGGLSGSGGASVRCARRPARWLSGRALLARLRHAPRARPRECEDRKSTRLNSIHVKISYAVFCLKKKTRRIRTPVRAPDRAGREQANTQPGSAERHGATRHVPTISTYTRARRGFREATKKPRGAT